MLKSLFLIVLVFPSFSCKNMDTTNVSNKKPLTKAEESDYKQTSTSEDVAKFLRELSQLTDKVKVENFGKSEDGKNMPLLIISPQKYFTPELAKKSGLPIVLIINSIHAGEIEGKEASLMLARELTIGNLQNLADKMVLLIVPLFNIDGNDAISKDNRKLDLVNMGGQIGPEGGVGTRYTSKGYNLNRDYVKQEAIEMRNLTKNVYYKWMPHITVDCHTTDGSIHGFPLTFASPGNDFSGALEPIKYVRWKLLPAISQSLKERTGVPTFYYGDFMDEKNPYAGWSSYFTQARFGDDYRGLTGMMDILSEVYSYQDFKKRVIVNYEFLLELFNYVAKYGKEMVNIVERAKKETMERGENPSPDDLVALRYECKPFEKEVEVLGPEKIATATTPEELGKERTAQLASKFIPYQVKFYANWVPTLSVPRPYAYAIPANLKNVIENLKIHNVKLEEIKKDIECEIDEYTISDITTKETGDVTVIETKGLAGAGIGKDKITEYSFEVTKKSTHRKLPKGTMIARTAQPQGNLIVYLLEPQSEDGLATWGFFKLSKGDKFPILRIAKKTSF